MRQNIENEESFFVLLNLGYSLELETLELGTLKPGTS